MQAFYKDGLSGKIKKSESVTGKMSANRTLSANVSLPKAGGGCTNGPKKLSDLENDLFYNKRIPFLTLTKADFMDTGDGYYVSTGSPHLDWLKKVEDIGFCITDVTSGEKITEDDFPFDYFEYFPVGTETPAGVLEYPVVVAGGLFGLSSGVTINLDTGEEELSDSFHIDIPWVPEEEVFKLELFRLDVKKIPYDLLDLSGVEAIVDEINGEVI